MCFYLAYIGKPGMASLAMITWIMSRIIITALEQEYTKRINNKFEGI
jgi:hypothetical protein